MSAKPDHLRTRARARRAPGLDLQHTGTGTSRYYQLYELLSGALLEGAIAPGSALPSEPTLCLRYGVSRTTVRRALERLELEGRIVRRRGSGTYALAPAGRNRPGLDLHRLGDSLAELDSQTTLSTLQAAPATVPDALRALGEDIEPGGFLLERVRRDRGGPIELTGVYFPDTVAARLPRRLPEASVTNILGRLGLRAAPASWSVGAVPADHAAARALEVPLGSPLLRARTVLVDRRGRVRAVLESLCRSDRLRLRTAGSGLRR